MFLLYAIVLDLYKSRPLTVIKDSLPEESLYAPILHLYKVHNRYLQRKAGLIPRDVTAYYRLAGNVLSLKVPLF